MAINIDKIIEEGYKRKWSLHKHLLGCLFLVEERISRIFIMNMVEALFLQPLINSVWFRLDICHVFLNTQI